MRLIAWLACRALVRFDLPIASPWVPNAPSPWPQTSGATWGRRHGNLSILEEAGTPAAFWSIESRTVRERRQLPRHIDFRLRGRTGTSGACLKLFYGQPSPGFGRWFRPHERSARGAARGLLINAEHDRLPRRLAAPTPPARSTAASTTPTSLDHHHAIPAEQFEYGAVSNPHRQVTSASTKSTPTKPVHTSPMLEAARDSPPDHRAHRACSSPQPRVPFRCVENSWPCH